jgi:hypothetical protein
MPWIPPSPKLNVDSLAQRVGLRRFTCKFQGWPSSESSRVSFQTRPAPGLRTGMFRAPSSAAKVVPLIAGRVGPITQRQMNAKHVSCNLVEVDHDVRLCLRSLSFYEGLARVDATRAARAQTAGAAFFLIIRSSRAALACSPTDSFRRPRDILRNQARPEQCNLDLIGNHAPFLLSRARSLRGLDIALHVRDWLGASPDNGHANAPRPVVTSPRGCYGATPLPRDIEAASEPRAVPSILLWPTLNLISP